MSLRAPAGPECAIATVTGMQDDIVFATCNNSKGPSNVCQCKGKSDKPHFQKIGTRVARSNIGNNLMHEVLCTVESNVYWRHICAGAITAHRDV
jgi:hypothetical protein